MLTHATRALYDADDNSSYLRHSFARILPLRYMILIHPISSYSRYSFARMQPLRCMTLTHAITSYSRYVWGVLALYDADACQQLVLAVLV